MTRDEFLKRLQRGLSGMPADARDDIMSDYAAHFDAAREEGRSDAEVAEALGDPGRLARELKLEAGIRRWQESRSPSSAWAAIIALMGLGALDILILLPILFAMIGVLIGFYGAAIGLFVGGGGIMIIGPISGFPGGGLAAMLTGFGFMAAGIALGAFVTIFTIWLVNGLMWFGRLHYRVIQPAIDKDA
ncbi:MAG: DUF1700 domain-containing protein [Novosphingobium sp.]|nr:DUF1700 domain-containing protein [Novosphingobium sp.]